MRGKLRDQGESVFRRYVELRVIRSNVPRYAPGVRRLIVAGLAEAYREGLYRP